MQRDDCSQSRRNFLRLMFGGAAALSLEACIGPPIEWIDPTPPPLQILTDTAIAQFTARDYAGAEQTLMPARIAYDGDAGYIALLSVTLAANKHYDNGETYFRKLIDRFEKQPLIITTIRHRMSPLFGTNAYEALKPQLRFGARLYPNLYAVIGFLELAEERYATARQAFELLLPRYPLKKEKYKELFNQLVRYANAAEDTIAAEGYKQVGALFEDGTAANAAQDKQ